MSKLQNLLDNYDNYELIKGIQFGILSEEEIYKGSVCEVLTSDTYDNNEPKQSGIFDKRLGVLNGVCDTCKNKEEICPGHFGRIDLAVPLYNIWFLDYIKKILKMICFACSSILVNKNDIELIKRIKSKKQNSRFSYVFNLTSKEKVCYTCNYIQPLKYTIIRSSSGKSLYEKKIIINIVAEFPPEAINIVSKNNGRISIDGDQCYQILSKIKDEDIELMGLSAKYSRPKNLILKSLPSPPPVMIPSVKQDGQRSEDDLTYLLSNIIKTGRSLKQKINAGNDKVDEDINNMQYYVASYMNNKIKGINSYTNRSGRILKGISQRLKGKEGRIRGNIMGKRVDFSARSVITVDTTLSIDELGVPMEIMMNLTYPEIVTKYNIEKIKTILRNGPNVHPGAKSVKIHKSPNYNILPITITLKYVGNIEKLINDLTIGDIVNRHLQDDDVVIFNRQPSLHRMSMMAMKIKYRPGKTFKLNTSSCKPFNADFDGDEMNLHVPQSDFTKIEILELASVESQIISPAKSNPIITIVQDTLTSAYLLTQDDIKIRKDRLFNCMMNVINYKEDKEIKEIYTGKEMYEKILPEISLKLKLDNGEEFNIENGNFKSGFLDNKTLGSHGLIQNIISIYGNKRSHEFLDDTQRLLTEWLSNNGFSLGMGDAIPPSKDIKNNFVNIINKKLDEINIIIKEANLGIYKYNLSDDLKMKSLELDIIKKQDECENDIIKYLKEIIPKNNAFIIQANAGTKGNIKTNLKQIIALLGQQSLWGNRVNNGYTDRTLPYFHINDIGPSAKGFIKNSFINGLEPHEFFFHHMGGRTGLIDTAVKTAESGYISRKLMKALEDIKICYDGTVRNSAGNIIQFLYGDDSFDPTKLEKVNIDLIQLNNVKFDNNYKFIDDDYYWKLILLPNIFNDLKKNKNYYNILNDEYNELLNYRDILRNDIYKNIKHIDCIVNMPFNINKYIYNIKHQCGLNEDNISDINPIYIINRTKIFIDLISKVFKNSKFGMLIKIYIKSNLSSKKIICYYKLNKIVFDLIITELETKFIKALINPGEMVGPIAAQSIGEVSTQMTLNTFHTAGTSSGSLVVTTGIPRMKEIINLSKNMKSPSMKIYLKNEYANNKSIAEEIKNKIDFTILSDIISDIYLIYENDDSNNNIFNSDIEFINLYEEFNDKLCFDSSSELSKWVIRIVFNKEIMLSKNITLFEIQNSVYKFEQFNDIECIISDDNANELIMRLKIKSLDSDDFQFLKKFQDKLMNKIIRGVNDISDSELIEENIIRYLPDGSYILDKEWVISTNGSNLKEILSIDDRIDTFRTDTNNIIEIFEIFGIEATKNKIISEMNYILMANEISNRHISLLSNYMVYKGVLTQIDRHGVNKIPDNGVISKITFEEVNDNLTKAALFGELDKLTSVSSNIMFNQIPKIGTGIFDILVKENIENYKNEKNIIYDESQINNKLNELNNDDNINANDFEFGFQPIQERSIGIVKDVIEHNNVTVIDDSLNSNKKKNKKFKN